MTSSHASGLAAGDRVRFRSVPIDPEQHAATFPGATAGPPPAIERDGTLLDTPRGKWVRVQYDDQTEPDSALVETLSRVDP